MSTTKSARRESFLLHMRPASFPARSVHFSTTFFLGFFAVFFLVLEGVTGILLMVYYVPSVDGAYASIIRLLTEVPFGWLLRDLHRLGGELMLVVTILHMMRILLVGSYRGKARLTWLTGIALLLCTLFLSFSGYLLPWDQRAYWAVTIGTSMADTIPVIGHQITLLLRGGADFGQDGLLRFYLLHIVILPLTLLFFVAVHYYRIARIHGIAIPPDRTMKKLQNGRVSLFPFIAVQEFILSCFTLTILIIIASSFYDAPLGLHADPGHTPTASRAPWFFLWLQGGLKLGSSLIMGVCFPMVILIILTLIPYVDRSERKPLAKRTTAVFLTLVSTIVLVILTYMGQPRYGVTSNPVTELLNEIAPEEEPSSFHRIGYDNLFHGVYGEKSINEDSTKLNRFLQSFAIEVADLENHGFAQARGVVIIEDWQQYLKKVTVRITWEKNSEINSADTSVYVYGDVSHENR